MRLFNYPLHKASYGIVIDVQVKGVGEQLPLTYKCR